MTKKEEKIEACWCEHCNCWSNLLGTVLTTVGCIAAIIACFYACKAANASQNVYELSVLSAGWIENIEKMNDLYKSEAYIKYITDYTDNQVKQFNSEFWDITSEENTVSDNAIVDDTDTIENTNDTNSPEFNAEWTLSESDIATLKQNWVIYGPENAKITILEFADASCGYCKRQIGQDKTVDAVMAQYPNDVNMMFKNFPIFNETAAQAMACAEWLTDATNYHNYVISVFQAEDPSNIEALANLAANYGIDSSAITNCVNNWEKAEEVATTMSEGQSFGISGTPSSVIINNESGEFALIPGAYPASTFIETIAAFLS